MNHSPQNEQLKTIIFVSILWVDQVALLLVVVCVFSQVFAATWQLGLESSGCSALEHSFPLHGVSGLLLPSRPLQEGSLTSYLAVQGFQKAEGEAAGPTEDSGMELAQ